MAAATAAVAATPARRPGIQSGGETTSKLNSIQFNIKVACGSKCGKHVVAFSLAFPVIPLRDFGPFDLVKISHMRSDAVFTQPFAHMYVNRA